MFLAFVPAAYAQAEGVARQEGLVSMVTGSGPVVQQSKRTDPAQSEGDDPGEQDNAAHPGAGEG